MVEMKLQDVAVWYNTCAWCEKEHPAKETMYSQNADGEPLPLCKKCWAASNQEELRENKGKINTNAT